MRTYLVQYVCSNCGHYFNERINCGEQAKYKVMCPKCECLTAVRSWSNAPPQITWENPWTNEPKEYPGSIPWWRPWYYDWQ